MFYKNNHHGLTNSYLRNLIKFITDKLFFSASGNVMENISNCLPTGTQIMVANEKMKINELTCTCFEVFVFDRWTFSVVLASILKIVVHWYKFDCEHV